MEDSPRQTLEEVTETLSLLLDEVGLTAELLFPALREPVEAVQTGRSPQALKLSEKLLEATELCDAIEEIMSEMESSFQEFSRLVQAIGPNAAQERQGLIGELPKVQEEKAYWGEFHEATKNLLGRLKLIENEVQLSSLGRMPIEDAWKELRAVVGS